MAVLLCTINQVHSFTLNCWNDTNRRFFEFSWKNSWIVLYRNFLEITIQNNRVYTYIILKDRCRWPYVGNPLGGPRFRQENFLHYKSQLFNNLGHLTFCRLIFFTLHMNLKLYFERSTIFCYAFIDFRLLLMVWFSYEFYLK